MSQPKPELRPMIRREVIFALMWAVPFGILLTYISVDKLYHIRSGGTNSTFQRVEATVPAGDVAKSTPENPEFRPWLYAWIWVEGLAIYIGIGVAIGMLVGWMKYRIRIARSKEKPAADIPGHSDSASP